MNRHPAPDRPVKVNFPWRNLGFLSAPEVRDLWLRQDLGRQENFITELPPHGCALLRLHSPIRLWQHDVQDRLNASVKRVILALRAELKVES